MNFSDPTLLILLGLAALGIISHNNTVTVAILVLLIIRLTPMEQYFSWVEKQGLTIGIIILTIGVLAPVASGTLSASTVLHSFLHWKSLLAIVIGVVVSWLGGRGVSLMPSQPSVVAGLLVGTVLGVALFRGVPVGPADSCGVAVSACGQKPEVTASRPSWLASVHHETAVMRCAGVRRLLVISGEPGWCSRQAALCDALAGDWLWMGEQSERGVGCRPTALKTLLAREFLHVVFDARQALSVDALAALVALVSCTAICCAGVNSCSRLPPRFLPAIFALRCWRTRRWRCCARTVRRSSRSSRPARPQPALRRSAPAITPVDPGRARSLYQYHDCAARTQKIGAGRDVRP